MIKYYLFDAFNDKKQGKHYIFAVRKNYIISYDYSNNKLYNKYNTKDISYSIIVDTNKNNDFIRLLNSCDNGNILIWDFHSAKLLRLIKISYKSLYGICLWNQDFLFIGNENGTIQLINIKKNRFKKNLISNASGVVLVKKIYHPKYEECLISQSSDNKIILWTKQ